MLLFYVRLLLFFYTILQEVILFYVLCIDVNHDTQNRDTSIMGVVCTTNLHFTSYHTQVIKQPKGQEIGDRLTVPIKSRCNWV